MAEIGCLWCEKMCIVSESPARTNSCKYNRLLFYQPDRPHVLLLSPRYLRSGRSRNASKRYGREYSHLISGVSTENWGFSQQARTLEGHSLFNSKDVNFFKVDKTGHSSFFTCAGANCTALHKRKEKTEFRQLCCCISVWQPVCGVMVRQAITSISHQILTGRDV